MWTMEWSVVLERRKIGRHRWIIELSVDNEGVGKPRRYGVGRFLFPEDLSLVAADVLFTRAGPARYVLVYSQVQSGSSVDGRWLL